MEYITNEDESDDTPNEWDEIRELQRTAVRNAAIARERNKRDNRRDFVCFISLLCAFPATYGILTLITSLTS